MQTNNEPTYTPGFDANTTFPQGDERKARVASLLAAAQAAKDAFDDAMSSLEDEIGAPLVNDGLYQIDPSEYDVDELLAEFNDTDDDDTEDC